MKILGVAQDPGGAEVLAQVFLTLNQSHVDDCQLDVMARGRAIQIFESAGVTFSKFEEGSSPENWPQAAEQILRHRRTQVVLTATSSVPSPERMFIRASKRLGLPSISILDSWTNYQDRFLEPGETQLQNECLPTYIGVANQFGFTEMEKLGFPRRILRIVGQPSINEFLRKSRGRQDNLRKHVHRTLHLDEHVPILVFFSQPIEAYYQKRNPCLDPGYSEMEVLKGLLAAISQFTRQVILIVKPHPNEPTEKFSHLKQGNLYVLDEMDPDDLAMAADVVISMTSGMLVKSFLLRKPVLSIQPNLRGRDECVLSRAGCITTVIDYGNILEVLVDALSGKTFRSSHDFDWDMEDGQPVQRILDLIQECSRN
jgi:hypothetical protein